jgi:hypothetical protein
MEDEKFKEAFDSNVNSPHDGRETSDELKVTKAGDWEFRPEMGDGIFIHKSDETKRIDVSLRAKKVAKQLANSGFKTSTATAMNGFHYTLRSIALLN